MKTRALQCYRPDMVANICAWCPDKERADQDAEARGYQLNHTICTDCSAKERRPMVFTEIVQTQNPNNPILLELKRLENESQK